MERILHHGKGSIYGPSDAPLSGHREVSNDRGPFVIPEPVEGGAERSRGADRNMPSVSTTVACAETSLNAQEGTILSRALVETSNQGQLCSLPDF